MPSSEAERPVRIAAAGDIHCDEANRDRVAEAFAGIAGSVDLILLAGDLTTTGEPDQAAALASACAPLEQPILAVLGNHDWHADRRDELVAVLAEGGIEVIDPGSRVLELRGSRIGVAGAKGFIGGFAGSSHLPDFGEPSLRRIYAEGSAEVEALSAGLREIATCDLRIALLHYSPSAETLVGEPERDPGLPRQRPPRRTDPRARARFRPPRPRPRRHGRGQDRLGPRLQRRRAGDGGRLLVLRARALRIERDASLRP